MSGYYDDRLAAEHLRRVYEIASPRVRQYLEAELAYVLGRLGPGDVVLELGCGYGRAIGPLAEKARLVVGVDTSLASLALARDELKGRENVRLVNADAVHVAFRDGAFDVVACIQNGISAFHVDPRALMAESVRVAKAGASRSSRATPRRSGKSGWRGSRRRPRKAFWVKSTTNGPATA